MYRESLNAIRVEGNFVGPDVSLTTMLKAGGCKIPVVCPPTVIRNEAWRQPIPECLDKEIGVEIIKRPLQCKVLCSSHRLLRCACYLHYGFLLYDVGGAYDTNMFLKHTIIA